MSKGHLCGGDSSFILELRAKSDRLHQIYLEKLKLQEMNGKNTRLESRKPSKKHQRKILNLDAGRMI